MRSIKAQQRVEGYILFFPSSPRCGSYDRAFDGLYLKRPFYYADGQHRYFTLYGTLQHYKFSATTVRTGNLRRIIAGHKKIWLFHNERDDGGVEVDRGRTNAKEGETAGRVTYVEFVSMSLMVPPRATRIRAGISSSSPSTFFLFASPLFLSCAHVSRNANAGSKIVLASS